MLPDHRSTYAGAILASLMAALALVALGLWARHLDLGAGVVPVLDAGGRSYWLVGVGLALVLGALFQMLDRGAVYVVETAIGRGVRRGPIAEYPTAWIVPLISSLTATMLLAIYHSTAALISASVGIFVALSAGTIARYRLFDDDVLVHDQARGFYTIIIHIVAFFALSMVYINKLSSRFSAPVVFIIATLFLLQVTEGEPVSLARRLIYALAGGVMLGELTWILGYWDATGWTGGATLLVFFYLSAGLIVAQVRLGVKLRDILEYGCVSLLAFAIVMYSLFR
ncbi:MAG TPA: hypothetical protein VNE17_01160 [Nitrolancea sp.]|nr:hypothetical protein [Nitrolancea sp.]